MARIRRRTITYNAEDPSERDYAFDGGVPGQILGTLEDGTLGWVDASGAPAGPTTDPLPAGVIVMWAGTVATIPDGWYLCDGQNGTPDLRDRFIVGARQDDSSVAKTNLTGSLTQSGGAVSHHHADHGTHTHAYTDVPNHVHKQTVMSAATGSLSGAVRDTSSNTAVADSQSTQANTGGVASGTTQGPGAALTHDTLSAPQPYFALAFIQKA